MKRFSLYLCALLMALCLCSCSPYRYSYSLLDGTGARSDVRHGNPEECQVYFPPPFHIIMGPAITIPPGAQVAGEFVISYKDQAKSSSIYQWQDAAGTNWYAINVPGRAPMVFANTRAEFFARIDGRFGAK